MADVDYRTCRQCHGSMNGKVLRAVYCCSGCKNNAIDRSKHRARDPSHRRLGDGSGICKNCGQAFKSKLSKAVYCRRLCARQAWLKQFPDSADQRVRPRRRVLRLLRRLLAVKIKQEREEAKRAKRLAREASRMRACRRCYVPMLSRRKLCSPCSVTVRKAQRRAEKAVRKARERVNLPICEAFDPFVVFDRDGWQCQLCGIDTPRLLRGTYQAEAPELDHIIPLALGGSHTRANTQCACRSCNGSKGATAGQVYTKQKHRGGRQKIWGQLF